MNKKLVAAELLKLAKSIAAEEDSVQIAVADLENVAKTVKAKMDNLIRHLGKLKIEKDPEKIREIVQEIGEEQYDDVRLLSLVLSDLQDEV